MALEILDVDQRSDAWYAARCGIVTASAVGALITVGPPGALTVACPTCNARRGDPCISMARKTPTELKTLHDSRTTAAASRAPVISPADNDTSRGLTAVLVAERITGRVEPTFTNDDMWRGIEEEPRARDKYAEVNDVEVAEVGFMIRREKGWQLGFSPDGTVGDDGLIEVKAPRAKGHLQTILADAVPAHHMAQLQAGLLVSGRKWIDFISWHGGLPMWTKRVLPDRDWFAAITAAATAFEETAERMTADYLELTTGLPATERLDMEIRI